MQFASCITGRTAGYRFQPMTDTFPADSTGSKGDRTGHWGVRLQSAPATAQEGFSVTDANAALISVGFIGLGRMGQGMAGIWQSTGPPRWLTIPYQDAVSRRGRGRMPAGRLGGRHCTPVECHLPVIARPAAGGRASCSAPTAFLATCGPALYYSTCPPVRAPWR